MELIEKIKAECERHTICKTCKFAKISGVCSLPYHPADWDIEAIRNVLDETSDEEEIVVPEKWDSDERDRMSCNVGYVVIDSILLKQNKIIECLEQIKERIDGD